MLLQAFSRLTLNTLNLRRAAAVIAAAVLVPANVYAAGLAPRSDQLGSSQANAVTTHSFSVTTATAASVASIRFVFCTSASGACTTPSGVVTTSAALTAQSGATGFTIVNTTNGSPYITRVAGAVAASAPLGYTLSNVTNPATTNTTFYVRVSTYTGNDGVTGPIDNGAIAASTAQQIALTGVTPEILIFCVGTAIPTDCSSMTGSTVDFGDFSPQATRAATSMMQASTNAAGGYNVTINGTTLASGVNTIPALGAPGASTVGVGQFGLNIRANTAPAIGSDPTGGGTGTYSAGYSTANQYQFVSGTTVANAAAPTNANTFTSSYIVNIGGAQAAGVYTATMTYICTANF